MTIATQEDILSNQFIRALVSRMSMEQKIGQCLVFGMSGTIITSDLLNTLTRFHIGGLRLSPFARLFAYGTDKFIARTTDQNDNKYSVVKNVPPGTPAYVTPVQFASMLNELRQHVAFRDPAIPLHTVIDQEGDVSKDYSRGGVIQFPSNMGLAASGDPECAYKTALAVGLQMKAAGLDMIHSPVVDVNTNSKNPEIAHRAFSDDPGTVVEFASAMLKGFKKAGVIATAKHFPGRGESSTDAHHDCPVVDLSFDELVEKHIYPYKRLIDEGLDAIMLAHTIYPQLDPVNISTVSEKIVTRLLREELGFSGVITTDSMTMGALVKRYGVGEACARALLAGSDIVLMKAENECRTMVFDTIYQWVSEGRITESELDQKVGRIIQLKHDYGLFDKMGMVDLSGVNEPIKSPIVIETARMTAQSAIMIVRDEQSLLPINRTKKTLLVNQLNTIKSPNDSYDHPSLFSQLVTEVWPECEVFECQFGYDKERESDLFEYIKGSRFEQIVCTSWYDRAEIPPRYPDRIINLGIPVILVTNTPYQIGKHGGMLKDADTVLLNMNLTPEGLRMSRDVLLGLEVPLGKWPLKYLKIDD